MPNVADLFSLHGSVAVVTGATGRLGPVWCEALLDAGAAVAAWDLASAKRSGAYEILAARAGERLRRIDCDVTSRESIESALSQTSAAIRAPSILVNNAGIDQPPDSAVARSRVEDLPIEMMRRMIDVNLTGTLLMTQVVGGAMAGSGRGGSIINIGSLYASVANDQRFYDHMPGDLPFIKVPSYGASKAGVISLTRYFAALWGASRVRVNALSPGGVFAGQDPEFLRKYSERVPLGRLAVAEDLSGPLLFLASRASSYVTGFELRVDGGFTAW